MREAKKKREKSLQFGVRLGKTCFNALKGVVSVDGDGERSSGACFNFTVSYVVACSIWCLACIRKAEVGKIRKDFFLHEPPSHEHQKTNS